ncbi:MAG: hypothetical protein NTV34_12245 [Proteobacteria bacterium]|nr:hypothetical protein [Pseudomonadota bacterium]
MIKPNLARGGRLFASFIGCIMGLASATSKGQELSWSVMSAKSSGYGVSCNKSSVQLVAAGSNMSLLFDDMNADLPGGAKQGIRFEGGICTVELKMTIPKNYYVTSGSSTILGGAEKSQGTTGYVQSATYLWGKAPGSGNGSPGAGLYARLFNAERIFKFKDIISEPFFQIESTRTLSTGERRIMCNATSKGSFDARMIVHVSVGATRQKDQQSAIIAIDTSDSNFLLGLKTDRCP